MDNQPESSYWFPEDLLAWSFEKDPDAKYNTSVVPLAQRAAKETLPKMNDTQTAETKVVALSIMNSSTSGNAPRGINTFDANVFSYWQYIDQLVYWGGSSGEGIIVPPSPKLYALRDVTATVSSIPLIASSIMSKKIAAGADAIVLDVTTGDGAFMKNLEDAKRLAQTMVRIGKLANRQTMAVISDMSQPLGEAIGNSLEVVEAIETLQGKGPKDLEEMCYALGSQMVVLAKKADSLEEARQLLEEALHSGKALEKFRQMITDQGGDATVIDDPSKILTAKYEVEVPAKTSGVVTKLVANELGIAAMMLGAGRKTKDEDIDHAVGIKLHKKVGESVTEGESLLTIYSNTEAIEDVKALIDQNIEIGEDGAEPPLIHDIITE